MTDCSLSLRQTPRHQGKGGISLRFEVFAGLSTSKSSRFWILVQFFGRPFSSLGPMKTGSFRFQGLKLKAQILSSNHVAQIKLPELTREAKRGPTLIEIHDKFQPQRAPEVRQRDVSADRFKSHVSIERKELALLCEVLK